jgi:Fe-S-cluster containining protein
MAQMAAYLGMEVEAFRKRYVRRVGFKFSLIEKPNYDCIFLENRDGRRVCQVYPVRPLQCRTWPFWSSNLKSPGSWAAAAETCPGMNTGDVKRYHQIERIRTAKKWADLT